MNPTIALLENFWIEKSKDRDLYYQTKRALNRDRRFFTERLGWKVLMTENVIKVEKIPYKSQTYMGIMDFTMPLDYALLACILIFLDEKENGQQFLLSELIETVGIVLKEKTNLDWTKLVYRKSLVRAIKLCEKYGMILVNEGTTDQLSNNEKNEVLYENTGNSRYFAPTYEYELSNKSSLWDFESQEEDETGINRIIRVYRRLITEPMVYWDQSDDSDALYIKNQRNSISDQLEFLEAELHIHKNSAYVVTESTLLGDSYPSEKMESEISLTICKELRIELQQHHVKRNNDDLVAVEKQFYKELLQRVKRQYEPFWNKTFREMSIDALEKVMLGYMSDWKLIRVEEGMVYFYPSAGKIVGEYSKETLCKQKSDGI